MFLYKNKRRLKSHLVRLIYRLFLDGKTQAGICRYLENLEIRSPSGKTKWSKTTVTGILTNEKYKGDTLLQTSFTVDFLQKKTKPNEGEVPQYMVEKAIVHRNSEITFVFYNGTKVKVRQ